MRSKIRRICTLLLLLLLACVSPKSLYAANYSWVQDDWSGGADPGASALHPADQTGWTKFYSKNNYVNTTNPGEISLSPQPNYWTQTADVMDFDRGILNNVQLVGTGSYVTSPAIQETNSAVTRTGTWYAPSPPWYGLTYIYSDSAGSTVSFAFSGTGVEWIGLKNSTMGIAEVYVDDVLQGNVDLYLSSAQTPQPQAVIYRNTSLTNAAHILKIVVTGTSNMYATGHRINVESFKVITPNPDPNAYLMLMNSAQSWTQTSDLLDFDRGILTNVKIVGNGTYVTSRKEETVPEVTKTGTWYTATDWDGPSGGSLTYSDQQDATLSFNFTGTGVKWIGLKKRIMGKAQVYLDGVDQGVVDLFYYNPNIPSQSQPRAVIWQNPASLSNTAHTLMIKVLRQRNLFATGYYVNVDAFDVTYPSPDPGAYLMLQDGTTSGTYESPSLDAGIGGVQVDTISWNAAIPAGSVLKFQIATNSDNQTWNFIGPDGTAGTYYDIAGSAVYAGHTGDRYIKYKAYLTRLTLNPADSPVLNSVTITYGLLTFLQGSYESPSFDTGFGGAFFDSVSWTATIPAGSALRFQMAANNDNQTWNFIGPDGTPGTYYTTSGAAIYSGHTGNRYVKYRAFFSRQTLAPSDSPVLNDVTINYGVNPSSQMLISSPYDTTDMTNAVNRVRWLENLPADTDLVLQLRTSPDGTTWGAWYGPRDTTFSASNGVLQIVVASTAGLLVGSRITLTNSSNPGQMEIKRITAIDTVNRMITLNSATSYIYPVNSILTDTYTDPGGTEPVNSIHRSSYSGLNDDRWLQYRVFLLTDNGTASPVLSETRLDYFTSSGVYQPDGVIDGSGDNMYGASGTGGGGTSSKSADPGFKLQQPLTYEIRLQNDGTSESVDDTYSITWNTPSDISGNWAVYLNDGISDLTSPVPVHLNVQEEKVYTLKVTPSPNAPAASTKDVILDIRSENDFTKMDSIKATTLINIAYQADGLIDGAGNNLYDTDRTGGGGTSAQKDANPGDTMLYSVTVQNEGNIADTYVISLLNSPPAGWKVLINDGSKDYDITNPSGNFTTPSIRSLPYSDFSRTYTLKVIPKGPPSAVDIILDIYSNGGAAYSDSLTAKVNLLAVYRVDGIIYGYGYDTSGNMSGPPVMGQGCGISGSGDNVYGVLSSGNGGCAAVDIYAGSAREITVGVQNEGNMPDSYQISWSVPADWRVVMQERLNDGSVVEYNSPVNIPTATPGNPSSYNGGEVPYLTFEIIPPLSFTSGSQTIIFDLRSATDINKVDSVKAVINSSDTTPPASVLLYAGNITATSVTLTWTAPGDDGVTGTASSYDLRYSTTPITEANFSQAVRVNSCRSGESNLGSPKPEGNSESCTVSRLFSNADYYFSLKASDEAGNISGISLCVGCPAHTLISNDTTRPGTITDLAVTETTVIKDPVTLQETVRVTLCWTATADDGTNMQSGDATEYELRYSTRYILEDGVVPGVGQVLFSNAKLVRELSLPKSQGMTECYLVHIENMIDTGGGIMEDRTRNTRFYYAIKALDEARNKSLLSNVVASLTALIPNAYNMVSVPYVPGLNTPNQVFGDDVGTPLYVYWWNSRGPNFDSGCYDGEPGPHSNNPAHTCVKLTSVKEGLGYFLWVPQKSIVLDVPPGSTPSPAESCVDDVGVPFQCYVMPLQEGWNMLGTTFDKEINFSSRDIGGSIERGLYVRRTSGNRVDIAHFQDAVTARNWIDSSVYTYNGVNYTYETCDRDGTGELLGARCSLVMQPWKAYWIRLHVVGNATFELLIPN